MTVSTIDARGKAVSDKLISKVDTLFPLSNIFTDMGPAMRVNQSIDIPTRASITVEQASNSSGATLMTLQTNAPVANNLIVDQHYGAVILIQKLQNIYDLNGKWSDQMSHQVKVELDDYIDIDCYDEAIRVGAWDTTATRWTNVAGATVTGDMVELAMAKMRAQKGVRQADLVWTFHPYGMGAIRRLSAFVPSVNAPMGDLGTPAVGTLHGIPVVESQSVIDQLTVATSAVTITSNVATATVAAGHGLVPGMLVLNSGLTDSASNLTAQVISSVTATTVVFPYTASNGAQGDGVGVLTVNLTCNGLLNRPWLFKSIQQVPDVKIVARSAGYIGDELQFDAIWGVKVLANSAVMIGSPRQAVA